MLKWLPAVNKQKFTLPPKLQVAVAIGGVAVEAEFALQLEDYQLQFHQTLDWEHECK